MKNIRVVFSKFYQFYLQQDKINKLILISFLIFLSIWIILGVPKEQNFPYVIWKLYIGFLACFIFLMGTRLPVKFIKSVCKSNREQIKRENSFWKNVGLRCAGQGNLFFAITISLVIVILALVIWYGSWESETGWIFGIGWTIASAYFDRAFKLIDDLDRFLSNSDNKR